MADVKVPALLHKMSKAAQKAWYKKNNLVMPDDAGGRSAAAAKKVKVAPRKEIAIEPGSVRALNAARLQAYMAKVVANQLEPWALVEVTSWLVVDNQPLKI